MSSDGTEKDHTKNTDPEDDEETPVAPWSALFAFTTKKHIIILFLAILFSAISAINVPAKAYLLGKTFNSFTSYGADRISGTELRAEVAKYCTYLAIVGLVNWLTSAAFFMFWLAFAEMQAKSARDQVFEGLLEKDMEWYDLQKNGIAASIPRMQMQIRELQTALSAPIGDLAQYSFVFFTCLGLAFYYAWNLTLVTIAGVPIIFVGVRQISRRVHAALVAQQDALSQASKHVTTAFSSIEMIKYFNGQKEETDKFNAAARTSAKEYLRQAHWNAFQQGFVTLCTRAMFVQGFWYGSTLIDDNKKNPGQVLTTFWAALQAIGALQSILPQLIVIEKGKAAGARLQEAAIRFKEARLKRDAVEMQNVNAVNGNIRFTNVSFFYPSRPGQRVLRDATMEFPAAQMTFVIGKSGSGKSTLGQLLMRFYKPESGDVTLDGTSVFDIDVKWLRRNVTLVEQQSTLFNDTVRMNIALGHPHESEISQQEVHDAIDFALLRQMVEDMPHGVATAVASKGSSMSGGQRQRMALARAKIRDSPILILDESTSALDHTTRSSIVDAIRKWRQGRTTLIVTHDLTQIQPQDFLYILQDGGVVEQGYRSVLENVKESPLQGFLATGHASVRLSLRSSPTKSNLPIQRSSSVYSQDLIVEPRPSKNTPRQRTSYVSPNMSPRPTSAIWSPYAVTAQSSPGSPFWRVSNPPDSDYAKPRWSFFLATEEDRPPKPPPKDTPIEYHKQRPKMQQYPSEMLVEHAGGRESAVRLKRLRKRSIPRDRSVSPLSLDVDAEKSEQSADNIEDGDHRLTGTLPIKKILATVWPSLGWWARFVLALGFLAALAHAVAIPIFSWLFSRLISTFFASANRKQDATTYSLGILGVAFGDGFGIYFMHVLLEYTGQCWVDRVRLNALSRILAQPKEFFNSKKNSVSRLAESLDRNAEEMRYLLSRFAGLIFVAILMMGTSIVWALIDAWQVTLVGLACAPYVYAVSKAYGAISSKWESASNDAAEAAAAIFTETFTSIKTVRSLTLEDHFQSKHLAATQHGLKIGLKRSFYSGFFFGLTESSVQFVTALIFYVGAILAAKGDTGVSSIIGTFSQLLFSIANVSGILEFIPQMSSSLDTATRLLRLANLPVGRSHEDLGTARISDIGDIEFRNCNFSYPSRPQHLILTNLTLIIRRNRTVALVGASGSGKSTIASLILGLYPPNPPSAFDSRPPPPLCISARPIARLDIPTLRSLIGVVPQTPVLFPTSLYENIVYGLPAQSPYRRIENVTMAAQQAGIDAWIATLPDKYDTLVGEDGAGLSGGQAQRIAIARVLVRDVKCLVLDECTSALDTESAALVRDTIVSVTRARRRSREGMTVVMITHSEEMMRIADEVVMLEQGKVAEEGSFEELIGRKGSFRRLLMGRDEKKHGARLGSRNDLEQQHEWRGNKYNQGLTTTPGSAEDDGTWPLDNNVF
ncbi:MAG: hypothetical protein M1822_000683 [Bathelium mastoideum]|nr:MAG: hypothetical protein M1822_000683 [Bathelium mastoideum]